MRGQEAGMSIVFLRIRGKKNRALCNTLRDKQWGTYDIQAFGRDSDLLGAFSDAKEISNNIH